MRSQSQYHILTLLVHVPAKVASGVILAVCRTKKQQIMRAGVGRFLRSVWVGDLFLSIYWQLPQPTDIMGKYLLLLYVFQSNHLRTC